MDLEYNGSLRTLCNAFKNNAFYLSKHILLYFLNLATKSFITIPSASTKLLISRIVPKLLRRD